MLSKEQAQILNEQIEILAEWNKINTSYTSIATIEQIRLNCETIAKLVQVLK